MHNSCPSLYFQVILKTDQPPNPPSHDPTNSVVGKITAALWDASIQETATGLGVKSVKLLDL